MQQGKCPGCGKDNFARGFCAECDSNIKNIDGIDSNDFLDSLPETEKLTMKLPTAQELASALLCKHAQKIQHRPLIAMETR